MHSAHIQRLAEASAAPAPTGRGGHAAPARATNMTWFQLAIAPPKATRGGGAQGPAAPSEVCPEPAGPRLQPDTISQALVDRIMGRYAKVDGDPGEGCRETPYVAGKTESVCTIGHGHQIPGCSVLSRATGERPTAEEIAHAADAEPREFRCACEGRQSFDCKGPGREQKIRADAAGAARYVHDAVPVELDQAQFDALVDLTLHKGHLSPELLSAITKYWCTDAGRDHVRGLYLQSDLQPFPTAFAERRARRVWPPAPLVPNTQRPDEPPAGGERAR